MVVALTGLVVGGAALAACGGAAASTKKSADHSGNEPTSVKAGGPVLVVENPSGSVSYDGQKPSTIDFSRDSTNIVDHLTWTSWGPSTALGHGELGLNNCQPNCATGTVTKVPATIRLSGLAGGHFTAMTEKAGSLFRTYSYPDNWALGAS